MTDSRLIYLDAFATTPVAPEAIAALARQLAAPGNPHSSHAAGAQAWAAVDHARAAVADLIGADRQEVFLTSGATEANNIAILGWARAAARAGSTRRTIVTSTIEHPSVYEAAAALQAEGFRHLCAPVDRDGRLDLIGLKAILAEDTLLLSVMMANNITGVIQPVSEAARLARAAGALVHVDAAQAAGKIPIDVYGLDIDGLSLSSHKLYGPAGVGALFVSAASILRPEPLVFGGGQESGLRPGTLPAGLIVGFGAAATVAARCLDWDARHLATLADRFRAELASRKIRFASIGSSNYTLPGAMNISFVGCRADDLVERLASHVAISSGSACSFGQIDTAPALRAMRLTEDMARSAVRIYFHRYSTEQDAVDAARLIAEAVRAVRLATGDTVQ